MLIILLYKVWVTQQLYGPPTHVCMVPSHMKCLHVFYDSYGPPIPYNK